MAFSDWMPTLQTLMQAVSGIKRVYVYDDLPAAMSEMPALVILPTAGDVVYSVGGPQKFYHDVSMTLYLPAQILGEAYGAAVPYITSIRDKLAANITLSGTVDHILPDTPFYDGPGAVRYAGDAFVGIVFKLKVKEDEAGDYTVAA